MKKFLLTLLACVAVFSAHAWTVTFTNPVGWKVVNVYVYSDGGSTQQLGGWPGKAMSGSGNYWTYSSDTATPEIIIFNNVGDSDTYTEKQTGNLTFVDGATYDMDGDINAQKYNHTVYFKNSNNWPSVNVHYWGCSAGQTSWPGIAINQNQDGLYEWTITDTNPNPPTFESNQQGGFMFVNGSNNDTNTGNIYNYVPNATYLPTGNIEGEAPNYSSYYVNIIWSGNWDNPGKQPEAGTTIATLSDLAIGNTRFQAKIYNGSDAWYTASEPIQPGQWVQLSKADDGADNSIAGSTASSVYTIQYNVESNQIYVTDVTPNVDPDPTPNESSLYLVGVPTSWGFNDNYVLNGTDGVYTATFNIDKGEFSFRFFTEKADEVPWNDTSVQLASNIEDNDNLDISSNFTDYVYNGSYVNGKGNWTVPTWPGGDVTITINTNDKTVKFENTDKVEIPEPVIVSYDIWSSWSGSEWSATTLTENNGKWVVEDLTVPAGQFGIRALDEEGIQIKWIAADGQTEIEEGQAMSCAFEGSNFTNAAGTYNISFDPEAMTITFVAVEQTEPEPGDDEVTYTIYAYNQTDWSTLSLYVWTNDSPVKELTGSYPGKTMEDGNVTINGLEYVYTTLNAVPGTVIGLKFNDGTDTGSEISDIELGDETSLYFDVQPLEVNQIEDPESYEPSTPVEYTLFARGLNNNWTAGVTNALENSDAQPMVYTGTFQVNESTVNFKIGGTDWETYDFGAESNDTYDIYNDVPLTLTLKEGGNDIVISNWGGGEMIITFNLETKGLIVEGPDQVSSGVSSLVDSLDGSEVIYNLQGQKVSNPTKGIYIINGKKVLVK